MAMVMQPHIITEIAAENNNYIKACYVAVHNAMFGEISISAGHPIVDKLLTTRGMAGMLNTVWLITCAMVFGGVMETAGMLQRITQSIIQLAHSTGSLIASTVGTCVFFNITASDQYLSIIVPGKMFAKTYADRNLAPENLSRSLEDAGTVTSVLIPWNTCGATQASVLGVATFAYAPYCFFNIISPFMSIIFGYFNIKIAKIKPE
jgi:NhaC family Na+:H+ antiporter